MRRRTLLCGLGAALAGSGGPTPGFAAQTAIGAEDAAAGPSPAPQSPYTILVGGLTGGPPDRWARAVAAATRPVLSPAAPIDVQTIGGRDGVTCANRLQTLAVADGRTAAVLPGETAIAFLTGDPRVHFQPGDWIPVLAGIKPVVIVLRGGVARLSQSAPIRLAAESAESPDLAAILAFDRLGAPTVPVFGLRAAGALRAFALNEVDALILAGERLAEHAEQLRQQGGVPLCTLTRPATPRPPSDVMPPWANLPTAGELARQRAAAPLPPALAQAYRAVVAAAGIEFMLVLPHLTAPAAVALWRQAGAAMQDAPAARPALASACISLTEAGAAAAIAPILAPSDAVLALRRMLFKRFGWRPS